MQMSQVFRAPEMALCRAGAKPRWCSEREIRLHRGGLGFWINDGPREQIQQAGSSADRGCGQTEIAGRRCRELRPG